MLKIKFYKTNTKTALWGSILWQIQISIDCGALIECKYNHCKKKKKVN